MTLSIRVLQVARYGSSDSWNCSVCCAYFVFPASCATSANGKRWATTHACAKQKTSTWDKHSAWGVWGYQLHQPMGRGEQQLTHVCATQCSHCRAQILSIQHKALWVGVRGISYFSQWEEVSGTSCPLGGLRVNQHWARFVQNIRQSAFVLWEGLKVGSSKNRFILSHRKLVT